MNYRYPRYSPFMNFTDKMSNEARVCLVFEEAHSLVPEWSSAANEGDKTATNRTQLVAICTKEDKTDSLVNNIKKGYSLSKNFKISVQ